MKIGNVWAIAFVLIFIAVLVPIGINQFSTGGNLSHSETFVLDTASKVADQSFMLTFTPVVADSASATLNGSVATETTDWTLNDTTGLFAIVATPTIDDTWAVSYTESVDFGAVAPLWVLIPTIILLFLVYKLYKGGRNPGRRGY